MTWLKIYLSDVIITYITNYQAHLVHQKDDYIGIRMSIFGNTRCRDSKQFLFICLVITQEYNLESVVHNVVQHDKNVKQNHIPVKFPKIPLKENI